MSPTELRLLLDSVLPFVIALAAIGAGGRIITAWIKRGGQRDDSPALRDITEQLRQLQQSVDTVAIEVERIEEAQRFNSRLLSEGREQPRKY